MFESYSYWKESSREQQPRPLDNDGMISLVHSSEECEYCSRGSTNNESMIEVQQQSKKKYTVTATAAGGSLKYSPSRNLMLLMGRRLRVTVLMTVLLSIFHSERVICHASSSSSMVYHDDNRKNHKEGGRKRWTRNNENHNKNNNGGKERRRSEIVGSSSSSINNDHGHNTNEDDSSSSSSSSPSLVSLVQQRGGAAAAAAAFRSYEAFIRRGHSHNDYHQPYPLSSALAHGLSSVEVDVFPRNGGLWVAHTVFDLNPSRTIDSLYIQPIVQFLRNRERRNNSSSSRSSSIISLPRTATRRRKEHFFFRSNNKRRRTTTRSKIGQQQQQRLIHPEADTLNLLVDFKGDAEKSIELLYKALEPLRPYLSRVDKNGEFHQGKVTVLISGNRPKDELLLSSSSSTIKMRRSSSNSNNSNNNNNNNAQEDDDNEDRILFLDGRLHDIRSNSDTTLVPLVSIPWRQTHLSRVIGRREQYMRHIAQRAHSQGKMLRIWGAPNRENHWKLMIKTNIDLLSIDDHAKFARFVSDNTAPSCLVP